MKSFRCVMPRTEFGEGRLAELGAIVRALGRRAFLALDPYFDQAELSPHVERLLAGTGVSLLPFSDIQPNPSCFAADEAAALARDARCDVIVALGGGSTIDFGKGVAVLATNPGTCWQYTERSDHDALRPADVLPIVAVPTTSGTGAEATPYAVFNNPAVREKSTIVNPSLVPGVALIDPELTYTMSPALTASTGFDALSHAIEAVISTQTTPFAQLVGLEAVRLIGHYLPRAVACGDDREARARMSWAATLAGAAIGSGGVALPHAVAQPVSGLTGAPHGLTIAACMPHILASSYEAAPERFAAIAQALAPSMQGVPTGRRAARCASIVADLMSDIDLRVSFSDLGLARDDIDRATHVAVTGYSQDIACHPKDVTEADIRRIYQECM